MRWDKAIYYGAKFFLISTIFTVMGALFILSSASISMSVDTSTGKLVLDFSGLKGLGAATLLIIGIGIAIVGNVGAFLKIFSEAVKEEVNGRTLW
jgi:hypothetical protein